MRDKKGMQASQTDAEGRLESGSGTPTIVPCWQFFDPLDQVGTL
jgi:hypothetical protein